MDPLTPQNTVEPIWENLPHHVLKHIFEYIGKDSINTSTVCRSWRMAAYLKVDLWDHLLIDISKMTFEGLSSLIALSRPLQLCSQLTIRFDPLQEADIHKLYQILVHLKYNPNLQCLTLQPKSSQFLWINNEEYFYSENEKITVRDMCTAIIEIASCVPSFKHLSWGLTDGLNGWQNFLLACLSHHQAEHLQSLHLATLYTLWPRCPSICGSASTHPPAGAPSSAPTTHHNHPPHRRCPVPPPLAFVDQSLLHSFILTHLSIDFVHLSESLLFQMAKVSAQKFTSLCLYIQNWYEEMPFIRDTVWRHMSHACPQLSVSLNLVQAPDAIRRLRYWLLQPSLPLTALRLYCCSPAHAESSTLLPQVLVHLATLYSHSLRSLHIIDCCTPAVEESERLAGIGGLHLRPWNEYADPVDGNFLTSTPVSSQRASLDTTSRISASLLQPDSCTGDVPSFMSEEELVAGGVFSRCSRWAQTSMWPRSYKVWMDLEPDPLVMLMWSCTQIEDILLTGYWINVEDVKALALLRGATLKSLSIPDCCLLFDSQTEADDPSRFHAEVSRLLGREWRPIADCDLQEVFFDPSQNFVEVLYLPHLWKEQTPCHIRRERR